MNRQPDKAISPDRFMRLFLASQREICRYLAVLVPRPDDLQDVLQETATALWQKIDQYDPNQPFTPWACRFALVEARKLQRKERRWSRLLSDEVVQKLYERRVQLQPHLDERRGHLADCIGRLPVRHKQVLTAYYFDHSPIATIAERFHRSGDAIYKLLQRTRERLQACIERKLRWEEPAS